MRDLGVLILGRLSIVLAAIISVRVMTTVLSPTQVGHYSLLTAFAMWFSLTLVSPAGNYVNRRFIEWVSTGVLWRTLRRYFGLLMLLSLFTAAASYAGYRTRLLDPGLGVVPLVLCVVGILVFLTVNSMIIGFLNLLGKRGLYVTYTSLTAWLGLGISVALTLRLQHHGAAMWIAGQIAGWALVAVIAYASLHRVVAAQHAPVHLETTQETGLWAFVWPLIISTSLYWFQVQGYRIEIEHLVGVTAVGLLTTGLLLGANPVTIIDTLLGEYMRPQYLKAIACNDRAVQEAAWSEMAGAFLSILIPVAVVVACSGAFLSVLLVGPSFRSVAGLIAWGVLLEFLRATNSLYLLASHTRYQTRITLRPAIVGTITILTMIVPLARWDLFNGTGLALASGMAVSTIYLAASLRPVFTTNIPMLQVIKVLFGCLPVALGLIAMQLVLRHPSQLEAVVVVTLACLAMLGVQFVTNPTLRSLLRMTEQEPA